MKQSTTILNRNLSTDDLRKFARLDDIYLSAKRQDFSGRLGMSYFGPVQVRSGVEGLFVWGGGFEDRGGTDAFGYIQVAENASGPFFDTASFDTYLSISGLCEIRRMHFLWDDSESHVSGFAFLSRDEQGIVVVHSNFSCWINIHTSWKDHFQHPEASKMIWEVIAKW
jgi:hypothetical protein